MVTFGNEKEIKKGLKYIEAAAFSTDTWPVDGIMTGSMMFEMDTGREYTFDAANKQWSAINAVGGGATHARGDCDSGADGQH